MTQGTHFADDATLAYIAQLEAALASRPALSARDVALKCADIAQITIIARARPGDDGADIAAAIRAYADTLGNESVAQPGNRDGAIDAGSGKGADPKSDLPPPCAADPSSTIGGDR